MRKPLTLRKIKEENEQKQKKKKERCWLLKKLCSCRSKKIKRKSKIYEEEDYTEIIEDEFQDWWMKYYASAEKVKNFITK